MKKLSKEDVIAIFESEFSSIMGKFAVYDITLEQVADFWAPYLYKPGVYVFWSETDGVIKVGRHLTNSIKRAQEHIRDDTNKIMKQLDGDPNIHLLLFNVKIFENRHWVAAVEIFLELNLKPIKIPSNRIG